MANSFNKEERVAFENLLEGFQDALVLSRNVSIYNTDQTMMERTNNTIWRPQPYVSRSYSGTDMTSNFGDYTQLAVPATIGFNQSVPWVMSATELRDALQEQRLGDSAKQKLASDINVAVLNVASAQGTLVVKRVSAATGFDDVAQCEAIMNEQGVQEREQAVCRVKRGPAVPALEPKCFFVRGDQGVEGGEIGSPGLALDAPDLFEREIRAVEPPEAVGQPSGGVAQALVPSVIPVVPGGPQKDVSRVGDFSDEYVSGHVRAALRVVGPPVLLTPEEYVA